MFALVYCTTEKCLELQIHRQCGMQCGEYAQLRAQCRWVTVARDTIVGHKFPIGWLSSIEGNYEDIQVISIISHSRKSELH